MIIVSGHNKSRSRTINEWNNDSGSRIHMYCFSVPTRPVSIPTTIALSLTHNMHCVTYPVPATPSNHKFPQHTPRQCSWPIGLYPRAGDYTGEHSHQRHPFRPYWKVQEAWHRVLPMGPFLINQWVISLYSEIRCDSLDGSYDVTVVAVVAPCVGGRWLYSSMKMKKSLNWIMCFVWEKHSTVFLLWVGADESWKHLVLHVPPIPLVWFDWRGCFYY